MICRILIITYSFHQRENIKYLILKVNFIYDSYVTISLIDSLYVMIPRNMEQDL